MTSPDKKKPPLSPPSENSSGTTSTLSPLSRKRSPSTYGHLLDSDQATLSATKRRFPAVKVIREAQVSPGGPSTNNLFKVTLAEINANNTIPPTASIRKMQQEKEIADERAANFAASNKTLEKEISTLAEKIEDNKIYFDGLQVNMERDKNNLKERVAELETTVRNQNEEIAQLKATNRQQSEQIAALQTKMQNMESMFEQLQVGSGKGGSV